MTEVSSKQVTEDNRILHTMLRVTDMEKSIEFYTSVLGMRVLRTLDQPDEKYTLSFLGYSSEKSSCVIELTYNYGVYHYDPGTAFGHIAIGVNDCKKVCEEIKILGGKITMEAIPLKGSSEIIAFISDPDGYQIELIQR